MAELLSVSVRAERLLHSVPVIGCGDENQYAVEDDGTTQIPWNTAIPKCPESCRAPKG